MTISVRSAIAAALCTGAAVATGGTAAAQPDVPPPPPAAAPGPGPIPSAPAVTTTSVDGWTLALTANSESLTPAPTPDPAVKSRDLIVGGLFNGTLRDPNGQKYPTPTGSIEVGYQVQCVPGGMLSMMRPAAVSIPVLKEDFNGSDPSAAVNAFRVQVDCLGPATVRSYAILTRAASVTSTVVAYYGVPVPA